MPAHRRDGQLRFDAAAIGERRLVVTVGSGRIELGHTSGRQVRVRWTVPALLAERWRARLHVGAAGPRVRSDASGLHIRARRARLRIDVPDTLSVRMTLSRGEITSWGAGGELELSAAAGRVTCRELTCRTLQARAGYVNLHFAAAPQTVDVTAPECVIALPPGPYAVSAPPDAVVEVAQSAAAGRRIRVSGRQARIVAVKAPLRLHAETPGQPPSGG